MPKCTIERRRRVGAEPDIERVAERELAGEAHHDVPGLADVGEVEDQDQHGEQVVAGEQRRGEQRRQQQRQQQPARARGTPSSSRAIMPASCPRCPAAGTAAPARGCAKVNMLLADGVNSSPAIASVSADQHAAEQRAGHRAEPADDDDDEGEQRVGRPERRRHVDDQHHASRRRRRRRPRRGRRSARRAA